MSDRTEKITCKWCGKANRRASDWEQLTLPIGGKPSHWETLCVRCASKRLKNPLNALLDLRKREVF